MHIVHVTRQFYPGYGGIETVVASLALHQVQSGHDVTIVTLDRIFGTPGECLPFETLNGARIVRISYAGSNRYPLAPAVLNFIRDADIVHVHAVDFFFDFLSLTSSLHRKKLVLSTHGGFFHTAFASTLKKVYFKTATRFNITRYAFVAASSGHDFKLFSGIRSKGIAVVANGVDCNKFAGLKRDPTAKQMLYFGRLAPNKNVAALLPLLAAVRALDSEWTLVIAGRPMGVLPEDLREAARIQGLGTAVSVIDSPSDDGLREVIQQSSVFVSLSNYEGFGIAAIEALSAGLMPVLSDIPPHRDTIDFVKAGLLVDPNRPEEAARRILEEWTSWTNGSLNETALAARLDVIGWPAVVATFEKIYKSVLGQTSRRILGACVQVLDEDQAIKAIDVALDAKSPMKIAFVNAHLANLATRRPALAGALESFFLLNDGLGMDLASVALYGRPFPRNLNGTDFVPFLLDRIPRKLRIYLLGATPDVVAAAARFYRERWPQHEIAGAHHGYFTVDEEAEVADKIRAATPEIILVALGNPLQELWLSRHIPDVCPMGIGVGALFDFQTNRVARAPAVFRKARVEWIYRLILEPGRLWRRYLIGNMLFLGRVGLQYARGERA